MPWWIWLILSLFMLAMIGCVTADDLFTLFLFWEATSLLSFLLGIAQVAGGSGQHERRIAAGGAPLIPLVDATTTVRPVSRARSRVIANCCSSWAVPVKDALLVCTVTSSAPLRTCAVTESSKATSKQIRSATLAPAMSKPATPWSRKAMHSSAMRRSSIPRSK